LRAEGCDTWPFKRTTDRQSWQGLLCSRMSGLSTGQNSAGVFVRVREAWAAPDVAAS
jgi:hypothetical protein